MRAIWLVRWVAAISEWHCAQTAVPTKPVGVATGLVGHQAEARRCSWVERGRAEKAMGVGVVVWEVVWARGVRVGRRLARRRRAAARMGMRTGNSRIIASGVAFWKVAGEGGFDGVRCRAGGRLRMGGMAEGAEDGGEGRRSLEPEYFRRVYAASRDPWGFETSAYEAAKYADTLRALPRARYGRGLEVGCSIGVLTERLAERCERLVAIDVAEAALAVARERCGGLAGVEFGRMQFPEERPEGRFDLVVVSEVAYYWGAEWLGRAMDAVAAMQEMGGQLVLVHWTPEVADYPTSGDAVHDRWLGRAEYRRVDGWRRERYRLDVLERVG